MNTDSAENRDRADAWQHAHAFGTDDYHAGERRTRWVIALTLVMMVAEIAGGLVYGSMALLADGWHMATHAAALGIAVFAYAYARRRAHDRRYTFGTGKVSALGGFGSAVTLAVVAVLVLAESLSRLWSPIGIHFNEAIAVAVVGLAVNIVSALLLQEPDGKEADAPAAPAHAHDGCDHTASGGHSGHTGHGHHGHDHNLRAAYLHVLADALTSVLAIVALIAGKFLGWNWLDAATGVLGSLVIVRWALGLLQDTSAVLLDADVSEELRDRIQRAIESDADNRVTDIHLWRVGRRHLAAIISIVTADPRDPAYYKSLLAAFDGLAHVTVEVQRGGLDAK